MHKLAVLTIVCYTCMAAHSQGCWVYDYDSSTYQRCDEQNLTLNAAWEEFQIPPTNIRKEI